MSSRETHIYNPLPSNYNMKEYAFDWEIALMVGTENKPKPPEITKGKKTINAPNRREAEKDLTIFLYRKYKPDVVRLKLAGSDEDWKNGARKNDMNQAKEAKNFTTKLDAGKLNDVLKDLAYDQDYSGRDFANGSILMESMKIAMIKPAEYKKHANELIKAGILNIKNFDEIKDEYAEFGVIVPKSWSMGIPPKNKIGKSRFGTWLNGLRGAVEDDEYDGPGHYEPVSEQWIMNYTTKNEYSKSEGEEFLARAYHESFLRKTGVAPGKEIGFVVEDQMIFNALYEVDFFKNAK